MSIAWLLFGYDLHGQTRVVCVHRCLAFSGDLGRGVLCIPGLECGSCLLFVFCLPLSGYVVAHLLLLFGFSVIHVWLFMLLLCGWFFCGFVLVCVSYWPSCCSLVALLWPFCDPSVAGLCFGSSVARCPLEVRSCPPLVCF